MKVIYCYGDSNTWGYDPRSYLGGRYPEGVRWTCLIEQRTGWKVINDGVNGRRIPESRQQIEALAQNVMQYLTVSEELQLWIMLGSNDLMNHPKAEYVSDRMKKFLGELMACDFMRLPMCHIRLISPPVMKPGEWVESSELSEESRILADKYEMIAEEFGISFSVAGEVPVLFDGVHFSEQGHREFAECLLRDAGLG